MKYSLLFLYVISVSTLLSPFQPFLKIEGDAKKNKEEIKWVKASLINDIKLNSSLVYQNAEGERLSFKISYDEFEDTEVSHITYGNYPEAKKLNYNKKYTVIKGVNAMNDISFQINIIAEYEPLNTNFQKVNKVSSSIWKAHQLVQYLDFTVHEYQTCDFFNTITNNQKFDNLNINDRFFSDVVCNANFPLGKCIVADDYFSLQAFTDNKGSWWTLSS